MSARMRLRRADGAAYLELGAHTAIIDEADLDLVDDRHWWAEPRRNTWYVRGEGVGRPRAYLHRFLMEAPLGALVDHANGNGLDNRRSNLRLATPGQNGANSRGRGGASFFKGVSLHRASGLWRAQLSGECLGYFRDERDAARAYDEAAVAVHGEFALINGVAS